MDRHVPTMRKGGIKKIRFTKAVRIDLDAAGIIGKLEIEEIGGEHRRGHILVSGTTLNTSIYSEFLFGDYFTVWEDDIEWL